MDNIMTTILKNIYLQSQSSPFSTPQGTINTVQNTISGLFSNYESLAGSMGLPQNVIYSMILFMIFSIMFIAIYYIILSKIFREESQRRPMILLSASLGIITALAFGYVAGLFMLLLIAIILGFLVISGVIMFRAGQYLYYSASKMAKEATIGWINVERKVQEAINELKKNEAKDPILEKYSSELEDIRKNIEESIKNIYAVNEQIAKVAGEIKKDIEDINSKLNKLRSEVLENKSKGSSSNDNVIDNIARMIRDEINYNLELIKEIEEIIASDEPEKIDILRKLTDVEKEYNNIIHEITSKHLELSSYPKIDEKIREKFSGIRGKSKDLWNILNSQEMKNIVSSYSNILHKINILANQPIAAMPAKRAAVNILKNYPEYLKNSSSKNSSIRDLLKNLEILIKREIRLQYIGEKLKKKIEKIDEIIS